MLRYPMIVVLGLSSLLHAADHAWTVTTPMYFLPPTKAIVVVRSGDPGPGAAKHLPLATASKFPEALKLPNDATVDVWYVPKDGQPLRIAKDVKASSKESCAVQEYLGVIRVKSDSQPRGKLLVTPQGDDGPESKKHFIVQWASDIRTEVAVLPGDYALWLVPESGARARRITDKVRVLPGKTVTIED